MKVCGHKMCTPRPFVHVYGSRFAEFSWILDLLNLCYTWHRLHTHIYIVIRNYTELYGIITNEIALKYFYIVLIHNLGDTIRSTDLIRGAKINWQLALSIFAYEHL